MVLEDSFRDLCKAPASGELRLIGLGSQKGLLRKNTPELPRRWCSEVREVLKGWRVEPWGKPHPAEGLSAYSLTITPSCLGKVLCNPELW